MIFLDTTFSFWISILSPVATGIVVLLVGNIFKRSTFWQQKVTCNEKNIEINHKEIEDLEEDFKELKSEQKQLIDRMGHVEINQEKILNMLQQQQKTTNLIANKLNIIPAG